MAHLLRSLFLLTLLSTPTIAQTGVDIMAAIKVANERFIGQVIAADLGEGRTDEPEQVYSLRMLTEAGDIIEIRIDAGSGAIIEVNGRGLVQARRSVQGSF